MVDSSTVASLSPFSEGKLNSLDESICGQTGSGRINLKKGKSDGNLCSFSCLLFAAKRQKSSRAV